MAKEQMYLGSPGAKARNGGNGHHRRLIRHSRQYLRGKLTFGEGLRQGACVFQLGARQPGFAQGIIAQRQKPLRRQRPRQRGQPPPNSGGGLVGDHLPAKAPQQPRKPAIAPPPGQRARQFGDRGQCRIKSRQSRKGITCPARRIFSQQGGRFRFHELALPPKRLRSQDAPRRRCRGASPEQPQGSFGAGRAPFRYLWTWRSKIAGKRRPTWQSATKGNRRRVRHVSQHWPMNAASGRLM